MGLPETTDVKSGDFPPIKADWYEMVFKGFEEKKNKNSDTYTKLELGFAESGRSAWTNMSHQEDFLWSVKQFKVAIGMKDTETDLTPYKGTHLMVFVKNRIHEGSNYPDPKKFKAMPNTSPAPSERSAPPKGSDGLPF